MMDMERWVNWEYQPTIWTIDTYNLRQNDIQLNNSMHVHCSIIVTTLQFRLENTFLSMFFVDETLSNNYFLGQKCFILHYKAAQKPTKKEEDKEEKVDFFIVIIQISIYFSKYSDDTQKKRQNSKPTTNCFFLLR